MKKYVVHRMWYVGRRAFTLVEILVVISIIMLIATTGIISYNSTRKNLAIGIETDKIVTLFHSLRDETQNNTGSAEGQKCYGIRFSKNAAPQKIETVFLDKVHGCAEEEKYSGLDIAQDFFPSEIISDESVKENLSVIFIPPYGMMTIRPDRGVKTQITFHLKNTPETTGKIEFNTTTGKVEKK